jgi:hypothetical protein
VLCEDENQPVPGQKKRRRAASLLDDAVCVNVNDASSSTAAVSAADFDSARMSCAAAAGDATDAAADADAKFSGALATPSATTTHFCVSTAAAPRDTPALPCATAPASETTIRSLFHGAASAACAPLETQGPRRAVDVVPDIPMRMACAQGSGSAVADRAAVEEPTPQQRLARAYNDALSRRAANECRATAAEFALFDAEEAARAAAQACKSLFASSSSGVVDAGAAAVAVRTAADAALAAANLSAALTTVYASHLAPRAAAASTAAQSLCTAVAAARAAHAAAGPGCASLPLLPFDDERTIRLVASQLPKDRRFTIVPLARVPSAEWLHCVASTLHLYQGCSSLDDSLAYATTCWKGALAVFLRPEEGTLPAALAVCCVVQPAERKRKRPKEIEGELWDYANALRGADAEPSEAQLVDGLTLYFHLLLSRGGDAAKELHDALIGAVSSVEPRFKHSALTAADASLGEMYKARWGYKTLRACLFRPIDASAAATDAAAPPTRLRIAPRAPRACGDSNAMAVLRPRSTHAEAASNILKAGRKSIVNAANSAIRAAPYDAISFSSAVVPSIAVFARAWVALVYDALPPPHDREAALWFMEATWKNVWREHVRLKAQTAAEPAAEAAAPLVDFSAALDAVVSTPSVRDL